MKFYFYSFVGQSTCTHTDTQWMPDQFGCAVISIHPYLHVHRMNMKDDRQFHTVLLSWQQITEQEYDQFLRLDE